ncbi:hypothetical protein ACWEKT_32275 [Nocardia takedensis]
MDRIVILGCGGSGKTFLANQIAELLDLPLTHLDAIHYDADWNPLPGEEFAARQRALAAAPRWLLEGNYAATLPIRLAAADTVIFLDLPATTCLLGIVQRRWRYRGGQHERDGVYDRITIGFLRYICRYRTTMRLRVKELFDHHGTGAHLITLTSRRAADRFLRALRDQHTTRN